jgi:stalled ribosome rescue protein Dom34
MKNIGIWLDKKKALIFKITDVIEVIETIISNVENFHPHGGSGTRLKGGPQDVIQDGKYLEREKHQFKAYFKDIVLEIENAEAILIFGPAEAKDKFKKELEDFYKEVDEKVKAVQTADSMTDNQVKAHVRDFFKSN